MVSFVSYRLLKKNNEYLLREHVYQSLATQISCVGGAKATRIVEFKRQNLGLLSERLRLSASWEPLGGFPCPPQLGPEIACSGVVHRVASP